MDVESPSIMFDDTSPIPSTVMIHVPSSTLLMTRDSAEIIRTPTLSPYTFSERVICAIEMLGDSIEGHRSSETVLFLQLLAAY